MKVWIFWEIGMGEGLSEGGLGWGVSGWCVGGILGHFVGGVKLEAYLKVERR